MSSQAPRWWFLSLFLLSMTLMKYLWKRTSQVFDCLFLDQRSNPCTQVGQLLSRATHSMAADFLQSKQESKREHPRQKLQSFCNVISEVTPHHLYHILFFSVLQKQVSTTNPHHTRCLGSSGLNLEAAWHINMYVKLNTFKRKLMTAQVIYT